VLITILIASSFADVITAALATHIMETIFAHYQLSSGLGFSLGIGIATISILVFGEIIPKNLAKGRGEGLFKSTLWIINGIFYTLYPLVTVLLTFSTFFVSKITGPMKDDGSEWVSSEKEIQFLIGYIKDKGLMESEKNAMLQSIFELGNTPVKAVLVPMGDIVSVDASLTSKDIVDLFLKYGFTRFPVYEGKKDNIIGMVHLKDIFELKARHEVQPLKDVMRPILYVPESVKVNQLLREFKEQYMHIAIVLDEHGGMIGMVTLEDLLEEIVGEIRDEYELATQKIMTLKDGGWLADAGMPLEELKGVLNVEFETAGAHTLGGFMAEKLGHFPQKGENICHDRFYFQVQQATEKRVLQVLIIREEEEVPESAE
jgi:CBS domain containing-hemolysin-like protein